MPILVICISGMQYYSNASLVSGTWDPSKCSLLTVYSGRGCPNCCMPTVISPRVFIPKFCLWVALVSPVLANPLPITNFVSVGGFLIIASKVIGHQRWFLLFMLVLQTSCVGALASASMENPTKSIMLTVIVSMCTAPAQLLSMVMIGFGIEDQRDMYVFPRETF
jgi:hypothetical protein